MAVHFNELVACIALWLSAIAAASSSSYQVEFQFHDYHNPTGYKANGACCDWFFGCEPTCETIFDKICLGPGDLESWGQDCPWEGYVLEPGYVGDDSIMFGATIGSISNPFSFTTSENFLQLLVTVEDSDFFGSVDLVDKIYVQISGDSGKSVASQTFIGMYNTSSLVLSYTLTCTQNYYGYNCSTYCVPSDASNGHYNCDPSTGDKICLPEYQNPDTDCVEVACALVCTGGGGSCSESGVCECSQGWSGTDCGTAQCAENCHPEGGYCDQPGQCLCNTHWNGTNCGQFLCHPNCSPVGGTCENAGGCDCLPDYTGEYCETDLNPCAHLAPCQNGGTCSNGGPDQYSCACPPGYTGMDCEEDIDECNMSPCANSATCINHPGSYQCLCVLGWTGEHCQNNTDDCSPQPCQNGGNCSDLLNSYYCSCEEGYEGMNCNLKVNDCVPYPCKNGGSCTNLVTNYTCECLPEYIGRNCEMLLASLTASPVVTLSEEYTTTSIPEIPTAATQGIPGAIAGVVVGLLLVIAVLVAVTVAIYLVIRRKKTAKKNLYDSSSGISSEISPGGFDNPTYTGLLDQSQVATHVQPMDNPLYDTQIMNDMSSPLCGPGLSEPMINGGTQCLVISNAGYQPTDIQYEAIKTCVGNPLYTYVSLGDDKSAHGIPSGNEVYSECEPNKYDYVSYQPQQTLSQSAHASSTQDGR